MNTITAAQRQLGIARCRAEIEEIERQPTPWTLGQEIGLLDWKAELAVITATPISNACPCHPEEIRSIEFAELEELIAAGWGNVKQDEIARRKSANGGVLPSKPPISDGSGGARARRDERKEQASMSAAATA